MDSSSIIRSAIIGASVVITGILLGAAFKGRNSHLDAISVVGLGVTEFTSDEILFSGSFGAKAMDAKEAYAIITADKAKVINFFRSKGFQGDEVVIGGASFEKTFRTIRTESADGNNTRSEEIFDGYTATQSISLLSKKNPDLMKRIEEVADQTSELINSGIQFNPNPLQYTFSGLPSLKHVLIEKASRDARERAQKIVETADGKLGKLKNASMGVFQITGQGSESEDTYGGNNDIYSKQKSARITVRLEYELE